MKETKEKLTLRPVIKHFMSGVSVKTCYCIEIYTRKKWDLLGDEGGIFKFTSKDERDAKMTALLTP